MGLTRWILAFCGYVRLEVSGVHPERVLNACAAAGIACTASEPVDAYTLRITVRARCADTVTELARRSQCEVKTLYRRGLPQLLRRAARYRGACAGLLVTVLVVLTSSLFIWRIDVTGNETLTTGQILRCLDECGVRPGTYWPALSNDLVRNDMVLRLPELRYTAQTENPAFHPGRTADVYAGETYLGTLGQVHPRVAEAFGLPVEGYIAALPAQALMEVRGGIVQYKALPRFPGCTRDLAVVCDESIPVAVLEDAIRAGVGPLLESVKLFDIYRSEALGADKKSVAFSLLLRDPARTLKDTDADAATEKAVAELAKIGAKLRT